MRLFGVVDGTVDRFDRAGWMTPPFDVAFALAFDPSIPTEFDADIAVLDGEPDDTGTVVLFAGEPEFGEGLVEVLATEPDDTSTIREL